MQGEGEAAQRPVPEAESPEDADSQLSSAGSPEPRRPSMRRPSPQMINTAALDIVDPLANDIPTVATAVSYGLDSAINSALGGNRAGYQGSTQQRYLDSAHWHVDDTMCSARVLEPFGEDEGATGECEGRVPSLEDKILMGEEIIVPDDCSIAEALNRLLPGGRILVKDGVHEWDGQIDIRATNIVVRGEKFRRRPGGALRCPKVSGRWNLAFAGSGVVEALDLTNGATSDGVMLVSGGTWVVQDVSMRCCSIFPVQARSNAAYKGFDVALHCSGGVVTLVGCRVGGIDGDKKAYHACHVTKKATLTLQESTVCYCYGAAFEVRDEAHIEMTGCEIKHNNHVFAAGYPNEAFLKLDRCKIYKNGSLWKASRPKEVQDESTNTDLLGYAVNLFTTA